GFRVESRKVGRHGIRSLQGVFDNERTENVARNREEDCVTNLEDLRTCWANFLRRKYYRLSQDYIVVYEFECGEYEKIQDGW
ncbi:5210_t:CDS:2, partial [Dentiscutata heterogama]